MDKFYWLCLLILIILYLNIFNKDNIFTGGNKKDNDTETEDNNNETEDNDIEIQDNDTEIQDNDTETEDNNDTDNFKNFE